MLYDISEIPDAILMNSHQNGCLNHRNLKLGVKMALFSKESYFERINVFEFELCPLLSPPSYKHYSLYFTA